MLSGRCTSRRPVRSYTATEALRCERNVCNASEKPAAPNGTGTACTAKLAAALRTGSIAAGVLSVQMPWILPVPST